MQEVEASVEIMGSGARSVGESRRTGAVAVMNVKTAFVSCRQWSSLCWRYRWRPRTVGLTFETIMR